MPLPENDAKWPPATQAHYFRAYAEWAAWYSANPEALAGVYGGATTTHTPAPWWRFWERAGQDRVEAQSRTQLHLPLASDMAATSASLLFGEAAVFSIPEANEAGAAKATQERLTQILAEGDVHNRLLEAADTCAALGGVFLKVDWDTAVASVPLLVVVQADAAIPEFRYGRLMAVTLWRVVAVDNQTVWRHVERHEPGYIMHGLYEGKSDSLGRRLDLEAHPETEGLQDIMRLPFDSLGIRYIPNLKPNRRFRGSDLGQSDYAGSEGLLDALDEVWTSWMRDIRLGKARIIVPQEYLEVSAGSFRFNLEQEVFTPLEMEPGAGTITAQQFAIRVDEHERTANALVEAIVGHAGYSPQTFGLHIEGRAETGTALRIRERKTLSTQQTKVKAWPSPLADLTQMMLQVDKAVFNSRIEIFRPQVAMADSLTPDENETAATVELLHRAGAISDFMKVKRVNPGWDDDQINIEVERIRGDNGLVVEDAIQLGID